MRVKTARTAGTVKTVRFVDGVDALDRRERARSPLYNDFRVVLDASTPGTRHALAQLVQNAERAIKGSHEDTDKP